MASGDTWDIMRGPNANEWLPSGTKDTVSGTSARESGTSTQYQTGTKTVNNKNTPDFALKALEKLISQLSSGGTTETRAASADRQLEIQRDRGFQAQYTKEAAFADASALQGRFTRQLLEQMMPQIRKAQESSGTSGGVVAGLMAQDAAARTAEAQAALGLQTAGTYGQINNQLAATLELLTRDNSPTTKALLEAVGLSRGTISQGTESTNQRTTIQTSGLKDVGGFENSVQQGRPQTFAEKQDVPFADIVPVIANRSPSIYDSIVSKPQADNDLVALVEELTGSGAGREKGYVF